MFKTILHVLVAILSVILIAKYIPGVELTSYYAAFVTVVILFVLNFTLRPILYILTLPINLLTLGLFSFIINGAILYFVGTFVQGFSVDTILTGIIAAFAMSVIRSIGDFIVKILP